MEGSLSFILLGQSSKQLDNERMELIRTPKQGAPTPEATCLTKGADPFGFAQERQDVPRGAPSNPSMSANRCSALRISEWFFPRFVD
jgi:hypothetical protein